MSVTSDVLEFLKAPRQFAGSVSAEQVGLWRQGLAFARQSSQPLGRRLRPAQVAAWEGSAAQRVALVLGPPGTGKTFLLASLATGLMHACHAANRPCRILLTGFTRESIGNLFEDLAPMLAANVPEVALAFLGGPPDQPLPDTVEVRTLRGKKQVADARSRLAEPMLVAGATAWSLYKLFEGGEGPEGDGPTARVFDLVVIDEASQMMVAQGLLCLSGLAEDGRVVVAGDDRQLPPVRPTHDAATDDGRLLGGSLYRFLKSGAAAEFRLEETFRLNAPLVEPVAKQFYDGQYFSAEAVQERRLELRPTWVSGLEPWQRTVLDPELPLCVLLHSGPPCSTDNPFERHVLRQLVKCLAERLSPGDEIERNARDLWRKRLAVVTPHRAQNVALRQELKAYVWGEEAVVETVDRIQGRERDAILAGYSVSDPEFALVEAAFLFDARRLNVTVTRARSKLILLVSRRLLEVIPPEEDVFDAAGQLGEYIYESDFIERVDIPGPDGKSYSVEIRGRRFAGPAQQSVKSARNFSILLAILDVTALRRTR